MPNLATVKDCKQELFQIMSRTKGVYGKYVVHIYRLN